MNKMDLISKYEYHLILNEYSEYVIRPSNTIPCCRSNRTRLNKKGEGVVLGVQGLGDSGY